MPGTLYMIPCPIGPGDPCGVLPSSNLDIMRALDYFIVENTRSARRFLSAAGIKPQGLLFAELNEHTTPAELESLAQPLLTGRSAGMISEAGLPGVADPGAQIAAIAHRHSIPVVPLVGPCSITLALMASGLNGQSFAFNGYLPIKNPDRTNAIRAFERRAKAENQSQIFIETPYRNLGLLADLLAACHPGTRLTVAASLTRPTQMIVTRTVAEWRSVPPPPVNKQPAIFIIL